ncbi:MAG: hypothetical protein ACXU7D_07435 [Burkholderiaceae bacterium]
MDLHQIRLTYRQDGQNGGIRAHSAKVMAAAQMTDGTGQEKRKKSCVSVLSD